MHKLPAYTLIELMVTISVIGILATIAVTQFSKARAQAEVGQTKVIVSDVGKSIEAFKAQEQTAGRVIVPRQGNSAYPNADMAGTTVTGATTIPNNAGASRYPLDSNQDFFSDITPMFTGNESTQQGSLSYSFKLVPQKIPDYVVYYGTTPSSPNSGSEVLLPLEGNFTENGMSHPKCYIFEAYLDMGLTGDTTNTFYYVRNGHLATFTGATQNGGASCANP